MTNSFNNILVVRTDRIGDVILTTPSLKALRQAYPNASISVLVAPVTKELLDGNLDIDEVIVDDRRDVHKGLGGFLKLISLLKKKKFDIAIVFHTKKRTNALCFLSGIARRIGYCNNKFGFLLTDQIKDDRHLGTKHEAQYCLDLLKNIDIHSSELALSLPISKESTQWAEKTIHAYQLLDSKMIIAIHPGASDPDKMWSLKNFAQLIDQLTAKYSCSIVMVGAADIRRFGDEIKSMVQAPVVDLIGQTSIGQLAALLKRCHLLISNDSGPVHVADAVETPVISIFTRNHPGINPKRWRPLGAKGQPVYPEEKPQTGPIEPQSVPISALLEAVDALFKLC